MVLQRNRPLTIEGTANAGEKSQSALMGNNTLLPQDTTESGA